MRLLPRVSVACALLALAGLGQSADPPAKPATPDDWAFRPVVRPTAHTNIDGYLLAKLREKKLTYAPEADRRTLARRLYFDLIGLPPTPEQVESFVNDKNANAYEKLVDSLLASPRFGERQALWWLDVVRYAETDGFNADAPRPNAWRYRDYVIQSFNADKPFDRFIKEQLAGDELYPNDHSALVATGFLRHYPVEYNAVNIEQRRYEILTDIADTTGQAFLGLTMGCARCQDHKYDPVSQEDYFKLQAFFAGMWPQDVPLQTPAEKADYAKRLASWESATREIRAEMDALEEPLRKKAQAKERSRFAEEYASLLDVPFEKRSPLEKQFAQLVEKQVYDKHADPKGLKGAEKDKHDALKAKLAGFAKEKPADPPRAMAMTDLPEPPVTKLLKRGDWRKPGGELAPGYIARITDADATVKPMNGSPGRRTALAEWIASKENPLTARVIVNRLWQHHFGYGLVRTSSDFGVAGDKPTHPELLDFLATELTANGWSLKHVHRLIVTSAAYRQGSRGAAEGAKADIENKLLWQFPRRRLEGETLRDALLAVSGQLNLKAGGPGVFPELPPELQKSSPAWKPTADATERNRRSVYVFVKRNLRYPLFALFDAPDRNETCSRRFATTTAPQALALMNDTVVLGMAKAFAARVSKEAGEGQEKRMDRAFALACGRPATAEERTSMQGFLKRHPGSEDAALFDLCHALLNLNEFLYVD